MSCNIMLTLITGQKAFQAFVDSIHWHDTFFRDIVYVDNEYQDRNYGSGPRKTDIFSVIDDGSLVRLLIEVTRKIAAHPIGEQT